MDPVQALAILSLGAFIMVLVTALFYVFTVRPRLLEPVSLTALGTLDEDLQAEFSEQRVLVEQLNTALAEHTTQLQAAATTAPPSPGIDHLRSMLSTQTESVQALMGLLGQQTERLSRLDARLERIELTAAAQAPAQLPERSAPLQGLIQAQADQLVLLSRRLDTWGSSATRAEERLAEHARILAALDRELAAQAGAVQTLDAKVSEHTTMLLSAAAERRAQASILETLQAQLTRVFPMLNKLLTAPPRPGQDRLTDIRGIGPVYAGKLYEAGIQTFKQLAAVTPEEIHILINEPKWRARSINAEAWIEQARLLASQREKVESIG